METVDDLRCFWETVSNNFPHRFRHVKSHFLNRIKFGLRRHVQHSHYFFGVRTLHNGDDGAFSSSGCLVGQNNIKFSIGKGRFVNTQVCSHILRIEKPFIGMFLLIPVRIITQMLFVMTLKVLTVNMVVVFKILRRCWGRIQTLLLKKAAKPTV